jgi:GNAT superfamily N-acetyltransferase
MTRLDFDEGYQEETVLDDGTPVHLRLVRPEDKPLMLAAWEELSPESRYRRFFAAKSALTTDELRYLTELDNVNHVAMGATTERDGQPIALGVARFVRLTARPAVADAAVTVVDEAQHKGLGRLLLSRLVGAARERGIDTFTCDILATNDAMRHLLKSMAPDAVERSDGPTVTIEMPLADVDVTSGTLNPKSLIYRLLALLGID